MTQDAWRKLQLQQQQQQQQQLLYLRPKLNLQYKE